MPEFKKKVGSIQSFHNVLLKNQAASCGVHMDLTLGVLEETRYKKKYASLIKKLAKELRLTYNEIESAVLMYYKFQKEARNPQGQMTTDQFRDILHRAFDMTDNEMNSIVLYVLDKSPNNNVSLEGWIRTLSLFLRGTFEEKIQHCYKVYDTYGQGSIPRATMIRLLHDALHGEGESEDAIRDLIEVIANKVDQDRDGKISYEDFYRTVTDEPLMMEPFGQCLPSRLAAHAFRTTFTHYTGKYY